MGIFMDCYKAELESVFNRLIDLGFEKQFSNDSREAILTYIQGEIRVCLIWETKTSNPWVTVLKGVRNALYNGQIERILREKNPTISNNPNVFNYWLFKTLPLKEYLDVYFDQVLRDLETIR